MLLLFGNRVAVAIFFMAKSFDNLYPQLTEFGNLHLAWRKASRGKRGKPAAASFEYNLTDELIHDLELMDSRRYEHASRQLEELGRLLGAWIKST